jgi:hypothetical protein
MEDKQSAVPVTTADYEPAVVTDLGTVTGATLGWCKKDRADQDEYWY